VLLWLCTLSIISDFQRIYSCCCGWSHYPALLLERGVEWIVLWLVAVLRRCYLEKWFVIELCYWQSLLFVKGVVHVVVGYIVHHGSCCCGMLNKEQNVFPETCFVFFMVVILSVTTVCQKEGGLCCCRRLHYQHNGFQ